MGQNCLVPSCIFFPTTYVCAAFTYSICVPVTSVFNCVCFVYLCLCVIAPHNMRKLFHLILHLINFTFHTFFFHLLYFDCFADNGSFTNDKVSVMVKVMLLVLVLTLEFVVQCMVLLVVLLLMLEVRD